MRKTTKIDPPVNTGITPRPYYTAREVAERFQVSVQTILQEIHEGRLQALKIRKSYRIGKSALERYEAENCTGCSSASDGK